LDDVVLYRIDAEKGEGVEHSSEFEVKGYPTFVALNNGGETFDRWIGYARDYFISTLKDALQDESPITAKMARFENSPNFDDALVLARYNRSLNKHADAVKYYSATQKLNQDPDTDYRYEIFTSTVDGARKDIFTFDDAVAAADAVLASGKADADEKYGIARRMTSLAGKEGNSKLAAPYLKAGIEALDGSEDPDDQSDYATLMADYSLIVTGDSAAAVDYKKKTMPDDWLEDASQLNNFAWWCFENNINLEEAEDLSRKSVKLSEPGRAKAMKLDTLAEICNARGKTSEAVEYTRIAVKEAPEDEYYKEQLERFEDLMTVDN
jgi:tetratricopeptide (TPR) repeat protein